MAWSKEEEKFLKENYDKLTVKEIGEKIGRTGKAVRGKLERLGISLRNLNRQEIFKWDKFQIEFLKNNFRNMSDKEIAIQLFNEDNDKAAARVFRKRKSLKLVKDEKGLIYKENKSEYVSRYYKGEKIYQHIENAEIKIGRKIKKGEVVHHINGKKKDNSIKNLYVCDSLSKHVKLHDELEKISLELFEIGLIKFDEEEGRYYINKNMLT